LTEASVLKIAAFDQMSSLMTCVCSTFPMFAAKTNKSTSGNVCNI